jgi:hypothetical protein
MWSPLKCKACGRTVNLDFELCDDCIAVVMELNRDLMDLQIEEEMAVEENTIDVITEEYYA